MELDEILTKLEEELILLEDVIIEYRRTRKISANGLTAIATTVRAIKDILELIAKMKGEYVPTSAKMNVNLDKVYRGFLEVISKHVPPEEIPKIEEELVKVIK